MLKSKGELVDELIHLAANLKEEDLKDPAVYGQVSQLMSILDPPAQKLPADLIQQLQGMPDPKDRLMQAAMATGAKSPEEIGQLVESLKSEGMLKAEDVDQLLKGAMQRIAPFNPKSALNDDQKSHMASWQGTPSDTRHLHREQLPKMEGPAKERALHKLSGQTKTKIIDGKRHFLLHRGMSQGEADTSVKNEIVNHPSQHSSWTPKKDLANNFANPYIAKPGKIVSAWIHEDNIHTVPRQYGAVDKEYQASSGKHKNRMENEQEVIVKPGHSSKIEGTESPTKTNNAFTAPSGVDDAINTKGKKETWVRSILENAHPDDIRSNVSSNNQSVMREQVKNKKIKKSEDILEKISPKEIQRSHILMFPVSIRGKQAPTTDDASYHVTLKWLGNKDKEEDHKKIQDVVNRHSLHSPENVDIEPHIFDTPRGKVHVLKLKGAKKSLEYAHHELSEENPSMHKYAPHITVSKELHDEVKEKGLTAKDIGLKIHPLEYRVGDKMTKRFMPQSPPEANEAAIPKKMAKAEDMSADLIKRAQEILETLEKSKNVREQKAKLYGTGITNTSASKKTPAQHGAVNRWTDKHLDGLQSERMKKPSEGGGKLTANGDLIDKPSMGQEGKVKHIGTGKSLLHEVGHIVRENVPLKEMQPLMDAQTGQIKGKATKEASAAVKEIKAAGGNKQKQAKAEKEAYRASNVFAHEPEYETQGIEQQLARRMGLPTNKTTVTTSEQNPKAGQTNPKTGKNFGETRSVPKTKKDQVQTSMSFDPKTRGKEIHQVVPSKDGKGRHISHLSSNISPETRQKIEQIDNGELKYNKEKGWVQSDSINSKINGRAAGRRDIKADAKAAKPPKANSAVKPAHQEKEPEQLSLFGDNLAASEASVRPGQSIVSHKQGEKLAASEMGLKPGMSFNKLRRMKEAKK